MHNCSSYETLIRIQRMTSLCFFAVHKCYLNPMQCAQFVKSQATCIPVFLPEIVLYALGKNMIFEICGRLWNYLSIKRVWYSVHLYYFQAWFKFVKIYCIVSKAVFYLFSLDSKQHYHNSSTVKKHVVSC